MKRCFGEHIRRLREELRVRDKRYSLRQVAKRVGIEPSLLSRIERGDSTSISEEKIIALADLLQEDRDSLLALSGKVSSDVQSVIRKRPKLLAQLIRDLKNLPDQDVLRIARGVRDGKMVKVERHD